MIVATEWRNITWAECPPALPKAYENLYEFGAQMRSAHLGNWALRSALIQVMKSLHVESRATPFFFALRGFYDGLAQKRTDAVEVIIAAHFHQDDDTDRIVAKDVGEFLATKFPGKSE